MMMPLKRRTKPDTPAKPICFRIGNAKPVTFQLARVIPKITIIVSENHLQANAKLVKIIGALNPLRSGFGLRNCFHQKHGKNCDDGDDNQKLNQRER